MLGYRDVPGLFIRNSDRFVYIERRYLNSRSKWVLKYMYLKVNISVNLMFYCIWAVKIVLVIHAVSFFRFKIYLIEH